jgi:uncharacterized C2H2 Zn-finger protein
MIKDPFGKITCPHCKKTFTLWSDYKRHSQKHHKKPEAIL